MPATRSDLLDRYLHAVEFWLPKAQQQDILAELGEDLHSQVEEREAALGHSLDEDDLAAILQRRGSPMKVASGYLPEQRLINPAMLPAYRMVLKIAFLWVLLPMFVVLYIGPLLASAHPERILLRLWAEAWRTAFTVVGVVTTFFAILDRYHVKAQGLDNWDPRKLPRVPAAQKTGARWELLTGSVFGLLAAACWVYLLWHRSAFTFPGGIEVIPGSIWTYVYWPVLAMTVTSASADFLAFLYPCWTPVRSRVRIGTDAAMLVLMAIVLKAGHWVEVGAANLSVEELAKVTIWVNLSIQISLVAAAMVLIVDAMLEIRRLLRANRVEGVRMVSA